MAQGQEQTCGVHVLTDDTCLLLGKATCRPSSVVVKAAHGQADLYVKRNIVTSNCGRFWETVRDRIDPNVFLWKPKVFLACLNYQD